MRPSLSVDLTSAEIARFLKNVHRAGECHEWTAYRAKNGYGVFCWRGHNHRAHRIAFAAFVGPIPEGMSVCHRCDNRACVEPSHLFLGSDRDNIRDAITKGRFVKVKPNAPQLLCKRGHDLSIHGISSANKRGRGCRICKQITDHARYARRVA